MSTKHTFDRMTFDAQRDAKAAAKAEISDIKTKLAAVTADVDKLKKNSKA